ncbi:MAG: ribulose-phosphate 3-epimerase [Parcubacteria group bacterium Gr01-1014_31]|nr:MAG: ribulose-phosphate 3-epimerase [Parcubacteria group bacterium Gr01-1014_31]
MVEIIPSILVPTAAKCRSRISLLSRHEVAWTQLDVADGTFVPTQTFHDPEFIDGCKPRLAFEVHLMTNVTTDEISRWHYPWVKKIIFHLETTQEPRRILQAIGQLGKLAGIALNPETPVEAAQPFLGLTDTLLIMGVKPGWGGQPLLPETVPRLKLARQIHPHGNVEVDGGANLATVAQLAAAGANLLVIGSALHPKGFSSTFQQLTTLAHDAYQNPPSR